MTRLFALAVVALVAGCTCKPGRGAGDAGPSVTADEAWLAGRLPPERPGTPRDGGTLTVRLPVEPVGLTRAHDRFNEGTMVRLTVGALYETLARIDYDAPGAPLTPWLATGWVESDDHLSLRVTLREGVTFHDGAPLTSADVKATLDAVLNPAHPTAGFRASFDLISKVEAPDAHTLVVTWRTPYFLSTRTLLAALPVLPAHALEGDFDTLKLHRAPIGTGPFRFHTWDVGEAITLHRHERYWGPRAHLDVLRFRFVKDETAAQLAFSRGEFDVMTRIGARAWRELETQAWAVRDYHRVAFPENAYAWLGFNHRRPPLNDVRVRRALNLLYPGVAIFQTVDLGLEPRTNCPFDPRTQSCDPSVPFPGLNPEGARALLDDAGWRDTDGDGVRDDGQGHRLSIAFLAAAQSIKMQKVLPLYEDSLRSAGVDARVELVDGAAYMSRVRAHDFDAIALAWATPDLAQDQYPNFHSSQIDAGANYLGYASPEADALLERIRVEFDPARRQALERELHRRLVDDQVYLFMGRRPTLDAFKRQLLGVRPTLGGYDWAKVAWRAD